MPNVTAVSSPETTRLSLIPVLVVIHSSLVSTNFVKSLFGLNIFLFIWLVVYWNIYHLNDGDLFGL